MVRSLLRWAARDYPTALAAFGTTLLLVIVLFGLTPRAPLDLSRASWRAIRQAESVCTPYASDILNSARQHHNRAWAELSAQMQRPLPLRSYYRADILFTQAIGLADAAGTLGELAQAQNTAEMTQRINELRRDLNSYERELRHSLKTVSLRTLATRADLKVSLAEQRLARGEPAETAIDEATEAVDELRSALDTEYRADSSLAQLWNEWFQETLDWTRKTDSSAVVVVKSTHCGYLINGGMVESSFAIELGYRSGRQKMHSGDGATPEGRFRIIARRESGAAYYRALDLDYPTFADRVRYQVARKMGTIPPDVGIGGSIQIHGEGGRETDWTEGCVAVTNEQMDRLMERLDVGDRVTIVRQLDGWP
ncbi:MAG: L,D-transpeptidase family protein [candidate division Zixibacteria bacterium]|nr:L,D-transpeptidase family protein [candidate division Zixibacteria bacterium]